MTESQRHRQLDLSTLTRTDAGMHALWDSAAFDAINSYETWSDELEDRFQVEQHIRAGHLVPINIHSDGTFWINIRADRASLPSLSQDEECRVVASSDVYRLMSSGTIAVSGIEYVGPVDANVAAARLAPGAYDVVVHLLDYDDLPSRDGKHPDFVITIGPPNATTARVAVETFVQR